MTITSRKNDAVKRFREVLRDKSLRDRKARRKAGAFRGFKAGAA